MGSDGARGRVLVLKERSVTEESGGQDPYEAALRQAGYDAHFLPVLSHRLVNLDKIRQAVAAKLWTGSIISQQKEGSSDSTVDRRAASRFAGVVFTSQRAVEAWAKAGQAILEDTANGQLAWRNTPFYAVGPATASALLRLDSRLRPLPSLILGAEESGSAERLASYITSRSSDMPDSPLLYLVGDKRKDTLPSLLRQQGISMHEIRAYETFQSNSFEADYEGLRKQVPFEWIVFFSPSGAKLLLPLLQHSTVDLVPRLAAIGPTTRDYLVEQCNLEVCAMADSPNPKSLVNAIRKADMP